MITYRLILYPNEVDLLERIVQRYQQTLWQQQTDDTALTAVDNALLDKEDTICNQILATLVEAEAEYHEGDDNEG
jgi:hypothetical protein